jgi:hypothetical protein
LFLPQREHKLQVFRNKIRKIFCIKKDEVIYQLKMLHNEDIWPSYFEAEILLRSWKTVQPNHQALIELWQN